MLKEKNGGTRPPAYRHQSAHERRSNCCLKRICFFLLLIAILVGTLFYLYTYLNPSMPSYQFQGLTVQSFKLQPDFSLLTRFSVGVKAVNLNKKIGFIYGRGNSVIVSYRDTVLGTGNFPSFYQGHENTTLFKVVLKGKSEFGSRVQKALVQAQRRGKIPLLVKVKVPVKVVLLQIPFRHFMVFVNCSLVVDSLSPGKKTRILSSKYNVRFSL